MRTVNRTNGFVPDSGGGFPVLTFGSGTGAFGARNGAGPLLTPREGPTDVALVAKCRSVLEKEGGHVLPRARRDCRNRPVGLTLTGRYGATSDRRAGPPGLVGLGSARA
jgi:hypothetical protein